MTRVLYLEDERWQSERSVGIALSLRGYDVIHCSTIDEADAHLLNGTWDVVILDIGLNSNKPLRYMHTSFVILERIRAGAYAALGNPRNLPVVFASGVWDMIIELDDGERRRVADLLAMMGVSGQHCVGKPIVIEDLDAAICSALAGGKNG